MTSQEYKDQIDQHVFKNLPGLNKYSLPRLVKISLNVGLPKDAQQKSKLEIAKSDLRLISGQVPRVTRAKKAVAGFKIRKGDIVGLHLTLRGKRMYDFLLKFISLALPADRDFRGFKLNALDQAGNFTLASTDRSIFPELKDRSSREGGLAVTIITTAKNTNNAKVLVEAIGLPFYKSA